MLTKPPQKGDRMQLRAAALSVHSLLDLLAQGTGRTLGIESSLAWGTAAHSDGQLHFNLAGEHLLDQPKAKGERACIMKELLTRPTLVRTSPLVEANAKTAQCKYWHPQTQSCARCRASRAWLGAHGRKASLARTGRPLWCGLWVQSDSKERGLT